MITFATRPSILTYNIGTRRRRYTPRLVVQKSRERWLVEVGWAQRVAAAPLKQRWLEVATAANSLGFGFEVLTEAQLDWQPRAQNVVRLLRAKRQIPATEERTRQVLAMIPETGRLINELMDDLPALQIPARAGPRIQNGAAPPAEPWDLTAPRSFASGLVSAHTPGPPRHDQYISDSPSESARFRTLKSGRTIHWSASDS